MLANSEVPMQKLPKASANSVRPPALLGFIRAMVLDSRALRTIGAIEHRWLRRQTRSADRGDDGAAIQPNITRATSAALRVPSLASEMPPARGLVTSDKAVPQRPTSPRP